MAAFTRAIAEYPDDPRAARALERAQSEGGDKQSALTKHLTAAERDRSRAPYEWTQAARLYAELGKPDDALQRLHDALATDAAFAPAVELAVELHLAAKRPDEAAGVLLAGADARSEADEPVRAAALRERAARTTVASAGKLAGGAGGGAPAHRQRRGGAAAALVGAARARRSGGAVPAGRQRSHRGRAGGGARQAACRVAVALARHAGRRQRSRRGGGVPAARARARRRAALGFGRAGGAPCEKSGRPADLPAVAISRVWRLRRGPARSGGRPHAAGRGLRKHDSNELGRGHARLSAGGAGGARAMLRRWRRSIEWRAAPTTTRRCCGVLLERGSSPPRPFPRRASPSWWRRASGWSAGPRRPSAPSTNIAQALELRPEQPIAVEALERAWKSQRNYSALADRALSELKDATDVKRKVRAYERLAYVDGELRGDAESALLAYESLVSIDPSHHVAMRVLEKRYLSQQRWARAGGALRAHGADLHSGRGVRLVGAPRSRAAAAAAGVGRSERRRDRGRGRQRSSTGAAARAAPPHRAPPRAVAGARHRRPGAVRRVGGAVGRLRR